MRLKLATVDKMAAIVYVSVTIGGGVGGKKNTCFGYMAANNLSVLRMDGPECKNTTALSPPHSLTWANCYGYHLIS